MKTVVSVQEIAELEIKPRAEVAEWRRLVAAEIAECWANRADWLTISCPACDGKDASHAFDRLGIRYDECTSCGTLYAAQRPSEAEMRAWYRESRSVKFWRERLLSVSADARQQKIVRPRADWILDGIAEYVAHARRLVDLSPMGRPLLDLVAAEAQGLEEIISAGVSADLDGRGDGRVRIRPSMLTDLSKCGPADVIVAIDVLDRASDPTALIRVIEDTLAPGGILFATTPVASGFEVQTLWERSPTIQPPDKLNIFSLDGIKRRFGAPMWEILELSTPGMFDVETVRQCIAAEPSSPWPRVVRALVERADETTREAFVEFLQANRLASFARLVVRRRT